MGMSAFVQSIGSVISNLFHFDDIQIMRSQCHTHTRDEWNSSAFEQKP